MSGDNEIVVGRVIRENEGKPVRAWLKNYEHGYWKLDWCAKVELGTNCPFEDKDGEPYAFCMLYEDSQVFPGKFIMWSFSPDTPDSDMYPGIVSDDGWFVITMKRITYPLSIVHWRVVS